MGNRAIIKGVGTDLGIYVHWNGGYDSVRAFCEYCNLKGYRNLETDNYGVARLAQVIGNFFGGGTSVGIVHCKKTLTEEYVDSLCLDNGVYEIKDWKISKHWNSGIVYPQYEMHEGYDLQEMLEDIDEAMPIKEQLGKDFLMAGVVGVDDLHVGDNVYIQDCNGNYDLYTVIGFGDKGMVRNGFNVEGVPFVDLYKNENGEYDWNVNNFIKTETIRRKASK